MTVVVDTVSKFLVTMLPAQKLQQGTLQVLRFDAIWRSASQAQLESGRTVTVRAGSIRPARPTPLAVGDFDGRASDDRSAPDFSAEWLG